MTPCLVGPRICTSSLLLCRLEASHYSVFRCHWQEAFIKNDFFFSIFVWIPGIKLWFPLVPLLTEPSCWPRNSLFKDFWSYILLPFYRKQACKTDINSALCLFVSLGRMMRQRQREEFLPIMHECLRLMGSCSWVGSITLRLLHRTAFWERLSSKQSKHHLRSKAIPPCKRIIPLSHLGLLTVYLMKLSRGGKVTQPSPAVE